MNSFFFFDGREIIPICGLNCSCRKVDSQSIEPQSGGDEDGVISLLDYMHWTWTQLHYSLDHILVPKLGLDAASPVLWIAEDRVEVAGRLQTYPMG